MSLLRRKGQELLRDPQEVRDLRSLRRNGKGALIHAVPGPQFPGRPRYRQDLEGAAAGLNVGDGFTDPFTLVVDHNQRKVAGGVSRLRRSVEQLTRERFGLKDAGAEQLTYESLVRAADSLPGGPGRPREAATSDFLTRWLEERAERGPGNSGS